MAPSKTLLRAVAVIYRVLCPDQATAIRRPETSVIFLEGRKEGGSKEELRLVGSRARLNTDLTEASS